MKLQYADLGLQRGYFFNLIKQSPCNVKRAGTELVHTPDPDLIPRIGFLDALSNEGKARRGSRFEVGGLIGTPHIREN